jgi:hypothetical protein
MDDEMPANLLQIVELATLGADQIAACTKQIHAAVLSKAYQRPYCLDALAETIIARLRPAASSAMIGWMPSSE